ncbi:AAA family ATPase [Methylobacterium soli]|uniref:AAA family ATPase n=1 Tax=Methylobacterium soli TaxID=553447 RepID=UPI00177C82B3|nr:AAA family ATPase [Methylobacterium soli]
MGAEHFEALDRMRVEQGSHLSDEPWTPMDDALAELRERNGYARFDQEERHSSPPKRSRFPILHVDDLEIGADPVWLIDGLLPATGFGVIFGAPKSGKSFLLADALFHAAMGRAWAGREVMQGAVVYITGEGVEGFKRRLIAMRRHYEVEGRRVPFLLIPVAPDLGHASGDDLALIEDVRSYLASIGNPPIRAIAIDTLARTMKGADENAAKDMTTFVDNCERIGTAFGCIVLGVHHAGKDVAKGSRGSNALDGAVDVMWSVEKGEVCSTATIHHMKDAEAGATWQFRLLPTVLREGGAALQSATAAVVEIATLPGEAQHPAAKRNKPLPDRARLLLDVLTFAIGEMGEAVKGDSNVPHDLRSVARENLKRYLELRGYWDELITPAVNRANLSRDLKTLQARGIIGATATWLWLR